MEENYQSDYEELNRSHPNGYAGHDDPFKGDIEYANRSHQLTEDFVTGEFKSNHSKRKVITEYSTEVCPIAGKTTVKLDKSKHANFFALIFTVFVILALLFISLISLSNTFHYTTMTTRFNTRASEKETAAPELTKDIKKPYVAMAVMEEDTGRLLYGYEPDKRVPMASTTKIATAIIALETIEDLDKKVVVPDESVGIEGTSIYLRRGEEMTVRDLLYGLILASGNDSAVALAIISAGSEDVFVTKMNELAQKLNLTNTHFTNPHGLHDPNHYTSAKDLASLTAYAMKNEMFRTIVGTKRYTIGKTNLTDNRYLKNKQKLIFNNDLVKDGLVVTGVKSGFTPEAGRCLVTSGYMKDIKVVVVVLNAPAMFEESESLLRKALNEYHYYNLIAPYNVITSLPVNNGFAQSVNIFSEEGFGYPLNADERAKIKVISTYPSNLDAPVSEHQEVGTVSVSLEDAELFSTPIYTLESVRSNSYGDILGDVIEKFN